MKYRIVKNGLGEYAIEAQVFWFIWQYVGGTYLTKEDAQKQIERFKYTGERQKKQDTWEVVG